MRLCDYFYGCALCIGKPGYQEIPQGSVEYDVHLWSKLVNLILLMHLFTLTAAV